MPTFNQGIRTEAGQDLFGRVDSGQTKIHYTKIVYSSLDLSNKSDDEIAQMTDVNPKELIVPNPSVLYKPKTATTDPETEIRAIGSNEILQKGFYINTYALFASDDSGHEILLGVTLDDHPSWLPAYDGVRPQALTYNWDIGDKDSNNVKFTDANDAYATYADLQQYSSAIDYSMNQSASGLNESLSSYSSAFGSMKQDMANDSTISTISSTADQNSNNVASLFGSTSSNASNLASLKQWTLLSMNDSYDSIQELSGSAYAMSSEVNGLDTNLEYNQASNISSFSSLTDNVASNASNIVSNSGAIQVLSDNVNDISSNSTVEASYTAELGEEIDKNSGEIDNNSNNISQLSGSVSRMPTWSDENATRSQANDLQSQINNNQNNMFLNKNNKIYDNESVDLDNLKATGSYSFLLCNLIHGPITKNLSVYGNLRTMSTTNNINDNTLDRIQLLFLDKFRTDFNIFTRCEYYGQFTPWICLTDEANLQNQINQNKNSISSKIQTATDADDAQNKSNQNPGQLFVYSN